MLAPYVLLLIRLEATLDSLPNIKRYAETMKVQPRLGAAVCYQPGVLTVLRISAAKVLCWALVSRTSQSGCQKALVKDPDFIGHKCMESGNACSVLS